MDLKSWILLWEMWTTFLSRAVHKCYILFSEKKKKEKSKEEVEKKKTGVRAAEIVILSMK